MGFFSKLLGGLSKTKKAFTDNMKYLFTKNELNDEFYEELEYVLISSDVGTSATERIIENLKNEARKNKIKKAEGCRTLLKKILIDILEENERKGFKYPLVIMVVGVNGVGKTTTIGKLANNFVNEGKSVLIAAADTFRAAASDQLSVWADRAKVRMIKSEEGTDPGAVVFDAITSAKAKNTDVLIIDTAGRLHNKSNLMLELKKISKIVDKEFPVAEYHKFIVLDATTGQNAVSQVKLFDEAVGLTDIVLTKLDGTAKGGIVFALSEEFSLPISYIGVGEKIDDLLKFNAKEFVDSIL